MDISNAQTQSLNSHAWICLVSLARLVLSVSGSLLLVANLDLTIVPGTLEDFSIKFRTDEGNWDIVANNTPVFFLRDPAKFPHFIHTQKRHPSTHLTHIDDSTVFGDYLSQNPESIHQVMVLFGDRGIPDSWRFMQGYVGHTMKMTNKDNEWIYVQIHLKNQQGPVRIITQEDSAKHSADHLTKDLYEAIDGG